MYSLRWMVSRSNRYSVIQEIDTFFGSVHIYLGQGDMGHRFKRQQNGYQGFNGVFKDYGHLYNVF
jgi:hypothetical protein